ncbi:MerR family transcriptional regulator [Streptococcus macacae]|uniref:Transcriptional regulator, MerR family n=1 Tax=Streptococcus macacae NCTC 11558 TaxID=764298 RepID=G5JYV8_9STRE|nr:MerR family transcriptional regulator [Streptococcus macacae]EHJ52331.1 transcriptional regulator, MerR family [Streptococcus macacae NCTC 11558]SUN78215.1 transcriptional regulator [Streptococcus macacae NCTC 11558]
MAKRDEDYSALLDVELLKKLVVGIGEVSKITAIPIRKIRYWEEKGIIHSQNNKEGTTRRYDYINIKKMLLIQEMLEEGFTLEASVKKVEKRLVTLNNMFKSLSDHLEDKPSHVKQK